MSENEKKERKFKEKLLWCDDHKIKLATQKYETHVTANNSTNNNVFFFVSDLKIKYYYN